MPYIPQEDRGQYEQAIGDVVAKLTALDDDSAKGHLNFIIYSVIKRYLQARGMRYSRAQDFIGGVLTCWGFQPYLFAVGVPCQLECYRRLLGPYEDQAITRNGDV